MGIRELRTIASDLGIKNYSKMNKVELEAAVTAAQTASGAPVVEPSTPLAVETVRKTIGKKKSFDAVGVSEDRTIGQINGTPIVVLAKNTEDAMAHFLGLFSKSDARKVRKLLKAAGYGRLASLKRRLLPEVMIAS